MNFCQLSDISVCTPSYSAQINAVMQCHREHHDVSSFMPRKDLSARYYTCLELQAEQVCKCEVCTPDPNPIHTVYTYTAGYEQGLV